MRRLALVIAFMLLAAGCGGEDAAPTTSTSTSTTTTTTTTTTTSTTTTTLPTGPAIVREEDSGLWVQTLQELLTCAGYGTLEADGVYGSRTAGAVQRAQGAFGKAPTGEPDDQTFALISRECERTELLDLGGDGSTEVAGNAVADDPDEFTIGVQRGSVVTLESDPPMVLTVTGEDGGSLSTANGSLVYESPAAQLATVSVTAPEATTYLLRIDLAPPGESDDGDGDVVEGPFDPDDWTGLDFTGDPPGGLALFGRATSCVGEEAGSPCHDYYGGIVGRPGSFTGSGADNPVEVMGWLLRDTGVVVDGETTWQILDAVVFEVPIGDVVYDSCYPQGGDRDLVAHADPTKGTVTGAVQWDWVTLEIEARAPDRVVCVDGSGDHLAVGPGFG